MYAKLSIIFFVYHFPFIAYYAADCMCVFMLILGMLNFEKLFFAIAVLENAVYCYAMLS